MIYRYKIGVKDLGGGWNWVSKVFPRINHACLLLNKDIFEYGANSQDNYGKTYERHKNVNKDNSGFDWNELSDLQGVTRCSPDDLERKIINSGNWGKGTYNPFTHNCHNFLQFCLKEIGCPDSMIQKIFYCYTRQQHDIQIRSALGNKNLDIECCQYKNETNIILYDAHGEDNQTFEKIYYNDGAVSFIKTFGSFTFAIDAKWGQAENGTPIILYQYNGTNAQKFYLKDQPGGYVSIHSALDTNYVIDVDGGNTDNSTKIQLWEYHGGNNQKFKLI